MWSCWPSCRPTPTARTWSWRGWSGCPRRPRSTASAGSKESGVLRRITARLDSTAAGFPLQVYLMVTLARHDEAFARRLRGGARRAAAGDRRRPRDRRGRRGADGRGPRRRRSSAAARRGGHRRPRAGRRCARCRAQLDARLASSGTDASRDDTCSAPCRTRTVDAASGSTRRRVRRGRASRAASRPARLGGAAGRPGRGSGRGRAGARRAGGSGRSGVPAAAAPRGRRPPPRSCPRAAPRTPRARSSRA